MTPIASADAVEEPSAKLGVRFWMLWSTGFAAILVVFGGGLAMLRPWMGAVWGSIAGGTGVIAFTLALIGWCMLPAYIQQKRGVAERMRPAYRRYMWRFLPAMSGYVVVLLLAIGYANRAEPTGMLAWLVAIAPAVPVLFAIRAIALLIPEETDEYLRLRNYRVFALTTTFTLAVCTVWGFLDLFGRVPHVQLWAVFPIWAVCMIPAQIAVHRSGR